MAAKSKKIVQLLPANSAMHIHREARLLGKLFSHWGWETELRLFGSDDSDQPAELPRLNQQDRAIIHFDTAPLPEEILAHPGDHLALVLHDYVPPEYHHLYADGYREQLTLAAKQLQSIVSSAMVSIGHSEKAIRILESQGASRVREVPLLFDFSAIDNADDAYTATEFNSDFKRVLSYGEVDGESGHDDLLKTFWFFRSFVAGDLDNWQLFNVGRYDRCEGSLLPIQLATKHYEIPQDWSLMASDLENAELDTAFRHAFLYASFDRGDLSGVGLIQAIASGVPALAVAEGAGSTVLGDSPLFFDDPIHSAVAESMDRVMNDGLWRKKILAQQRARLELYDHTAIALTLRSIFSRW